MRGMPPKLKFKRVRVAGGDGSSPGMSEGPRREGYPPPAHSGTQRDCKWVFVTFWITVFEKGATYTVDFCVSLLLPSPRSPGLSGPFRPIVPQELLFLNKINILLHRLYPDNSILCTSYSWNTTKNYNVFIQNNNTFLQLHPCVSYSSGVWMDRLVHHLFLYKHPVEFLVK
jgi:hypothetical protein